MCIIKNFNAENIMAKYLIKELLNVFLHITSKQYLNLSQFT